MSGADPHEAADRLPRFAKDAATEALLAAVNEALVHADLPSSAAADPQVGALVYVVGTPRSGTTLAHQLLASCLDVGYVDNIVARFWLRPSVGIALSGLVNGSGERQIALRSEHGVSDGPAGPHEFGYFWRHWLALDRSRTHHLDPSELARVDAAGLGETLRNELLAPFGRTVVVKNLVCGLQARFLSTVHRPSLFVFVTRDEAATARSILASRKARYGDYGAWWSLKPSTWPFPESAPEVQVVKQVRDLRAELETELAAPEVHSIEVEYESICADPESFVGLVRTTVGDLAAVAPDVTASPPRLEASAGPTLPQDLEERLRFALYST